MDKCYILDANAIREIGIEDIKGQCSFVLTVEEVAREVGWKSRNSDKVKTLCNKNRIGKLDRSGYDFMKMIMQRADVRKIVRYYDSEGTGDAAILAYALQLMSKEEGKLLKCEYIIVTNDKGVQRASDSLGIAYIDVAAFNNRNST